MNVYHRCIIVPLESYHVILHVLHVSYQEVLSSSLRYPRKFRSVKLPQQLINKTIQNLFTSTSVRKLFDKKKASSSVSRLFATLWQNTFHQPEKNLDLKKQNKNSHFGVDSFPILPKKKGARFFCPYFILGLKACLPESPQPSCHWEVPNWF